MSRKFPNGIDLASRKITNLADPTSAQDAATKAYVDGLTYIPPAYFLQRADFSIPGIPAVGAIPLRWGVHIAIIVTEFYLTCDDAPSTGGFILDVNYNGSTMFTTQANRPTVASGGNVGGPFVPNVTSLNGSYIKVDVDAANSGGDAVLTMFYYLDPNA